MLSLIPSHIDVIPGRAGSRPVLLALSLLTVLAVLRAMPLSGQGPANIATAATATTAVESTTAKPRRASWFSDRRSFQRGEVISVIIDEFTLVAAGSVDRALDRRRGEGLLTIFPASRNGLSVRGRDESDLRGRATRDDRLRTEISVRVVDIDASGTLRLEGRKVIAIDKHEQEFVFRGWARPQDVLPHNVVEGWRVANLELLYMSNGELKKPKKGMISRLLGILF